MSLKKYVNLKGFGFKLFPDPIPGKQIKWIKCKDTGNRSTYILEVREIEGEQYGVLFERKFRSFEMGDWTDELIQKEPYTSDEDLKKFKIYNEG